MTPQPDLPSESTARPSARRPMLLLAEQQTAELPTSSISKPTAIATTIPPPEIQVELQHRAAWRAGVLGAFNVAATILAVRIILLLGIAGALALAWVAIRDVEPLRLGALGLYMVGVVLPLVWLSSRR